MLEYDDPRSGTFDPLKDIPDDKFVVLGLISTKKAKMESPAELRQGVSEASRYVPLERLGLSPQCGFASSILGNPISSDTQRQKLELAARTAHSIWD
ncbi:MAG: vitamin-B12 independent methionine synthase [Candidatus Binatia bacterium]